MTFSVASDLASKADDLQIVGNRECQLFVVQGS